ncbi:hypothetical protein K443DRAFT_683194 [Laccaria amethystina LaAM-08-1]|uniref:Uncharacterized protein n=1 Tax=Laccaria amethystina LaAM-08-1 TaxID=1095629 RepID=A0A0C9X1M4_9AGAR|nr:hypothetical protein K443DRAFT_683194 [Laccaria amethystina LaAM-08-1]
MPIKSYRTAVLFSPVRKETSQTISRSPSSANIRGARLPCGLARLPDLAADPFSPRRVTSIEPRTNDRHLSAEHSTPSSAFSLELADGRLHVVSIRLLTQTEKTNGKITGTTADVIARLEAQSFATQ